MPSIPCMWPWTTVKALRGHTHRCGSYRDHKDGHECGVRVLGIRCGVLCTA